MPGKFHGQRSLACYSPRGGKESDTTELTHTHIYKSVYFNLKISINKGLIEVLHMHRMYPYKEIIEFQRFETLFTLL